MSHPIDDIADYLEDEGVGTVGTDIFVGYLPESPAACVSVLDTGGVEPDPYLPTKSPTFQIFIRATNYDNGKTKLDAIRTALHRKFNSTLSGGSSYFYYILAVSEGGHIGRDENGADEFSINFRALLR